MRIHIVGCGLLGSGLAFKLCKYDLCSHMYIYDSDIVETCHFPYMKAFIGTNKVDALSSVIDSLDCDVRLFSRCVRVTSRRKFRSGLVVDCRDNKSIPIECNIRLSLDGPVFVVDCRKDVSVDTYSEYVMNQDPAYCDLALSIALNFVTKCQDTMSEEKRFVYMLDSILNYSTSM